MSHNQDVDRLYREGVAAIRAGDNDTARRKLMEAIRLDRTHEQAWLWLSAVVDTDAERATCLENVLTINPSNAVARRGLEKLGRAAPAPPPVATPAPAVHPAPPSAPPPEARESDAPEPSPVLVHGQSRVAQMIAHPQEQPDEPDESWRASLYTPEALAEQGSFASLVRVEPVVKRSLLDLFNVWGNMLIFNLSGGFREEIKYGGFGHIVANVIAGGLLQAVGMIMLLLVLFAFSRGSSLPPLLQSLVEVAGGPQQGELSAELASLPSLFRRLDLASLFAILLGYGVVSIPVLFVVQMFRGLVIDFVAGQLKGRGDIMQTLHAVTVALVVAQIAQIPVIFLLPLLPLGVGVTAWLALRLYQFLVEAVAVGEVHRFGIFLSMGVLIISGMILGALGSAFFCLLSLLGAPL